MFQHLTLDRPLAVLDLETTGINPATDRIVQVCVLRTEPDGRSELQTRLVNPGVPIPAEATAVHRITDADVAAAPLFDGLADLAPLFVLGDLFVVYGANDSDHYLLPTSIHQCGLLSPDGVGVVPWDPPALGRAERHPGGPEAEARQNFVRYEACGTGLKRLIHANLALLLARLEAHLGSSAG